MQHRGAEQAVGSDAQRQCSGAQGDAACGCDLARKAARPARRRRRRSAASARRAPAAERTGSRARRPRAPARASPTAPARSRSARRAGRSRCRRCRCTSAGRARASRPARRARSRPRSARCGSAAATVARRGRRRSAALSASAVGVSSVLASGPNDRIIAPSVLSHRASAACDAPMASALTDRLSRLVKTMRGQARITEDNVQDMLREVRMALLEADVALPVVRDFIARVKDKALGPGGASARCRRARRWSASSTASSPRRWAKASPTSTSPRSRRR